MDSTQVTNQRLCKTCNLPTRINKRLELGRCKCNLIRCERCTNKLKSVKIEIPTHYNRFNARIKAYKKFEGYICTNSRCEMFEKRVR